MKAYDWHQAGELPDRDDEPWEPVSTHTHGPWEVLQQPGQLAVDVRTVKGPRIASVNSLADAMLCASAPDLLRELTHLVRLLEPLEQAGTLNIPGLATLNGARAVIARATGEEPR